MTTPGQPVYRLLVVGYGNRLRGDDAAGPLVTEVIEQLNLEGVRAQVCHQLTPELAEAVAGVETVVFIDAAPGNEGGAEVREIWAGTTSSLFGHAMDPTTILALAGRLFGRVPRAWLVTVAARSFELGASPSAECAAGIEQAIERVKDLCTGQNQQTAARA